MSRLAKGPRTYKTIRASKKRRSRAAKLLVRLPKIGAVLLFISRTKDGTRFFITNSLKMTESQRVELYLQRVWIETFHQDIKQHLGFGEMFMRSWDGVQTHWAVLGIACNMIALSRDGSTSFRRHSPGAWNPGRVLRLRSPGQGRGPSRLWNGNRSRGLRQMIRHFRNTIDPDEILKCFTH